MPAKKLTPYDYRARKIKAAYVAKGMTQGDVAKRMKVEPSCMSRRIAHVSNMKVADLMSLCKLLGLSVAEVLEVEV